MNKKRGFGNSRANFEVKIPEFISASSGTDHKESKQLESNVSKVNIKSKKYSKDELNQLLIDNFVSLQHTMTNLAEKFNNLSVQISKLLGLFEISAKTFVERSGGVLTKEDKELLEKIDRLMDQNKTIAKALTLIEERVRGKDSNVGFDNVSQQNFKNEQFQPRPLPHI